MTHAPIAGYANATFTASIKLQRRLSAIQSTAKRRLEIVGASITAMVRTMVFLCMVAVTSAATWQTSLPEKPKEFADQEGCYIEETNQVVPYGSTVHPTGYCYRILCGTSSIHFASCSPVIGDPPKCSLTETDLTKPYPDCCPYIKCDGEK